MTNNIKNQYYYWQESYFDKRVKKRRRRRKSIISNLFQTILSLSQLKFLLSILLCLLLLNEFSFNVYCQDELEFDIATTLRPNKPNRPSRPTRTKSSTTTSTTASTTTPTTTKPPTPAPKTTPNPVQSTTVSSGSPQGPTSTAPYHYAAETLNKTHANLFKNWLDVKSNELYQLSMNYSGFKLLNETYNLQLREDAKFSWINFTEMIMEISNTISEVLYNKTLIVKNLSEAVEDAFDKYRNDTRRVKESANHIYYDTKSPKTFCDVQEIHNQRAAKQANLTATPEPTTRDSINTQTSTPPFSSSSSPTNLDGRTNSVLGDTPDSTTPNILDPMKNISSASATNDLQLLKKSNFIIDDDYNLNYDSLEFDFVEKDTQSKSKNSVIELHNKRTLLAAQDYDDLQDDDESCENTFPLFLNSHKTASKTRVKRQNPGTASPGGGGAGSGGGGGGGRQRNPNRPKTSSPRTGVSPVPGGPGVPVANATKRIKPTKPTKPKSASTTHSSHIMYDDMEERTDLEAYDDYSLITAGDKSPFWNVTCINRTFDENFKNFQKGVNRNVSTVHVPINVYKQDIEINMTAYWTEALNEKFRKNYDSDNELFWQYFCSSNGLFRRYPGAYWTVPAREDFFDCRLQSWYIMAAASPKDVLILLDSSGSMTGSRLEIAKKLIESIMDTLSDNDFFNVFTFSNKVDYLMNLKNETEYRGRFVQAGKTNKLRFVEKLKYFKTTANIANFENALIAAFKLLLSNRLNSDSCGCNKVIMIITDGASENAEAIFKKYNWENGRKVRVFTFLIGRDIVDTRHIKWMACANDGQFFHVGTIADVNEHVHEYIPVLSRPMALAGTHETTWSNVFIGHMDKELKIAVARPAFQRTETLLAHYGSSKKHKLPHDPNRKKLKPLTTTTTTTTTEAPEALEGDNIDYYESAYEYDEYGNLIDDYSQTEEPRITPDIEIDEELQERIDETLDNQQVLLGVVGVDVPVLRLISKVSPKYQMGVGIYIMMIDNNGFIVFHPSIRRELQNAATDSKGTSASIDIEKFEIPVGNEAEYEQLEHEMIDEITGNITLENWKREGMRVTRRRTEYVYTSVLNTPFSVAIASPSSFGRFYIDLPPIRDAEYESELKLLVRNRYESAIQLYNCSYNYTRLTEKILNPKLYSDYCIRYLFTDKDQVRSIKSDLLIHDIYYNMFNFSIFAAHPNLVRSSFYGTFSGITFYLPVTFWRYKYPLGIAKPKPKPSTNMTTSTSTISKTTTQSTTSTIDLRFMDGSFTEPQSEMTVDVLGSILEPKTSSAPTPNTGRGIVGGPVLDPTNDTFIASLNLFSNEGNKHTYSFEKEYYTRTIEFSDFLRSKNNYYEPVVTYFLNETSKEARKETVSASLPIWLDKIPAAVTGAVYDAVLFRKILFENYFNPPCHHPTCRNVCSEKRGMNVTCYLVDEHGYVVMSTVERLKGVKEPVMGQPLYKINPWLMKSLEYEGIFNLIIPGARLPECRKASTIVSGASNLFSLVNLVIKTVIITFSDLFKFFVYFFIYSFSLNVFNTNTNTGLLVSAQHARHPTVAERIELFNTKWRSDNSHCFFFGIYSFNITRWKELDASEYRMWCNSTAGAGALRKYLAGYVKHSNLLMLVVEDEFELYHCGNMSTFISQRSPSPPLTENLTNTSDTSSNSTLVTDLTVHHGGSSNNKEEILDISKYHLMSNEHDALLLLNDSSLLDLNGSNVTYITDYKLNIKTHINRYRKKPDHCHSFFENERDYLPCHNSLASRLFHTHFYKLACVFVSVLLTLVYN